MFQNTTIIGNVGNQPEMRTLPSGTSVLNFSVAVSESWNDSQTGERREKTTWFRASLWGKRGEALKPYINKGDQIHLSGTVSADSYVDQHGAARSSLNLRVTEVTLLRNGGGNGNTTAPSADVSASASAIAPDDIPF